VSMLDENGSPQIVERAKIVPPRSQVGAISADQRKEIIASSIIAGHYEKAIDRESAYEKLQERAGEKAQTAGAPSVAAGPPAPEAEKPSILAEALGTATAAFQPTIGPRGGRSDSLATSMVKSAMRAASSSIGRQIARGILGGILGGSGRRR
jgi:DNA double-strand break repair helicase HerA and related ATPase